MSPERLLERWTPAEATARGRRADPVDGETRAAAAAIVERVRAEGDAALRRYAEELDGLDPAAPLVAGRAELERACDAVGADVLGALERTAARVLAFAEAQRASLVDVEVPIPGGVAGQRVAPVERAGCYAPGGRFPLPSSVLMTAVTARAAGVREVWVASPRPAPATDRKSTRLNSSHYS